MKFHFIAIGGSVMHNLALSLRKNGHKVTGSDDEIFDPAKTALKNAGILPEKEGWFAERITPDLDAVILGMHAKADNPELLKARELKLPIYSFPAFVAERVKDKTRIVVAGSHGKTTITSMLMHVLSAVDKKFDYLVGSKVQGFDLTVQLTDEADLVVIEGDEYLSSALEPIPKFLFYKPHTTIITGIAWDHVNVFPTFENYVQQFDNYVNTIEPGGNMIYFAGDEYLQHIAETTRNQINKIPYSTPRYRIEDNVTYVTHADKEYQMSVFGKHNLQNMEGCRLVCETIGMDADTFYTAMQSFTGAARRMEPLYVGDSYAVYRDFAHSPSKLKATTEATKEQYPNRKLVAVMELHTYSSLNKEFLTEYRGCMDSADMAIVYFSAHALEIKRLPPITAEDVKQAFKRDDLLVFTETEELYKYLLGLDKHDTTLLLMSSGNFGGMEIDELI